MVSTFRKRAQQVIMSAPHYVREARNDIHSFHDAYIWAYFKLPYRFRLEKFPSRITIEPTNSCNFGCPHCRRSIMTRPVGNMDPKLFAQVIDEIANWRGRIVKLGGLGEPATYPELPEFMRRFKERGIRVILYTNGTLLRLFSPSEILSWNIHTLVVSIDGTDAASYERLRVGGKYAETVEAVAAFFAAKTASRSLKPEMEIRHVIMPNESRAELSEFRRSWLRRADSVKFNFLMPMRPGAPEGTRPKCRDIRRELYVRWDGRVPVCGYQSSWLGDLNSSTIEELWNHPSMMELRESHKRRNLTAAPACQRCTFR